MLIGIDAIAMVTLVVMIAVAFLVIMTVIVTIVILAWAEPFTINSLHV